MDCSSFSSVDYGMLNAVHVFECWRGTRNSYDAFVLILAELSVELMMGERLFVAFTLVVLTRLLWFFLCFYWFALHS